MVPEISEYATQPAKSLCLAYLYIYSGRHEAISRSGTSLSARNSHSSKRLRHRPCEHSPHPFTHLVPKLQLGNPHNASASNRSIGATRCAAANYGPIVPSAPRNVPTLEIGNEASWSLGTRATMCANGFDECSQVLQRNLLAALALQSCEGEGPVSQNACKFSSS